MPRVCEGREKRICYNANNTIQHNITQLAIDNRVKWRYNEYRTKPLAGSLKDKVLYGQSTHWRHL